MDRGYPPSKWDIDPDDSSSQGKADEEAANRTVLPNVEGTPYNNAFSGQARREKLAQAYGRTLVSTLRSSPFQPSSSSMSSAARRIPPPSDTMHRNNPFPTAFKRKKDEQYKTEAPKTQVLGKGRTVPTMPVHVGSSVPISPVTVNADALQQRIMLAGINALGMNNPTLRAQIVGNLPLSGENVKSSVPDGSGLLKYRAPVMDSFVFDQKAGYKFDPTTGLHYDANSGLFINLALRIFLRWDPLLNTYLRVDLPGLGKLLGVGVVPRNSDPVISQLARSALPSTNVSTGVSISARFLPADQLSNRGTSSTSLPTSEDSFMDEIWQRMRALAKEAIGDEGITSNNAKDRGKTPESDETGKSDDHCSSNSTSSSRSRSSSWKGKRNRHRRHSSQSRARSLSRGSNEVRTGKKRPRRSRSSDVRSRSRGRNRTQSRSPGRNRRGSPNRRARRSRSRRRKSSGRGPRRSISRSPIRSRGARGNSSRGYKRSRSRGRKSADSGACTSHSRRRSRSRGARRSRSKGARRSHSRGRRSHSREARRSHSRGRRRSISPDPHKIPRDMSPSPDVPKNRNKLVKRKASRGEQRPSESPKRRQLTSTDDHRKGRAPDEDIPKNSPNIKNPGCETQERTDKTNVNEETQGDSDGLSEFEFLKETLDDDNESVIVDEYEEILEHDDSVFQGKEEQIVDVGDVLGCIEQGLVDSMVTDKKVLEDPLAPLFSYELPNNVILVAPIRVSKKAKSELSLIESFLETSLKSEGVNYDSITLHVDKNVGAPCSYGLISFRDPGTAADWRSRHDGFLSASWEVPTSGEPSRKVFLHFTEDNWVCRNCQTANFSFRTLCHQCFVCREENVSGPIKKSTSTTRWVATSKLNEWFTGNDSIVADLKSLMKDLKLKVIHVLRDPKLPVFPLGCVFETESWGESLRLREFLHRTGRLSQFVTTNQRFGEFTRNPNSSNISKTRSADSDEPNPATGGNQGSNGDPLDKAGAAAKPLPVAAPQTTCTLSEECTPAIVTNQNSDETPSEKKESATPSSPVGENSASDNNLSQTGCTESEKCATAIVSNHSNETPLEQNEMVATPLPVGADSASDDSVSQTAESEVCTSAIVTSENSNMSSSEKNDMAATSSPVEAQTASGSVTPRMTSAVRVESVGAKQTIPFRAERAKLLPGVSEWSSPSVVDACELVPDGCCKPMLLWWKQDAAKYSDVLNHLFMENRATYSETLFVGPLANCHGFHDSTAPLEEILMAKLKQDNLESTGISIYPGRAVGGPCTYALVKFKTLRGAKTFLRKYKDGLILPRPQHSTEKPVPKNLGSSVCKDDSFRTFVYNCKTNWKCHNCRKFNFGLRSYCFNCFSSRVRAHPPPAPIIKSSKSPTNCVCIRKYKPWCPTKEHLYSYDPFFEDHKASFTVRHLKEKRDIPLGACILETKNVSDAHLLLTQLRKTASKKLVGYVTLNQPIPLSAPNIHHQPIPLSAPNIHPRKTKPDSVVDEFKEMFSDDTPTKTLLLGPVPDLINAETSYKPMIQEDGTYCIKVECCLAVTVGAPLGYYLIHFNSVDSAANCYNEHGGRMILKRRSLSGLFETGKPVTAFLHFSEGNWTCDCGSKNFPLRSICFACFKGKNSKSPPFFFKSSTPTKWLGVRSTIWTSSKLKALGLKQKNLNKYKVLSVTFYSDPGIPKDVFGMFIVETVSTIAAFRLERFYSSQISRRAEFVAMREPGSRDSACLIRQVIFQVRSGAGLDILLSSGSLVGAPKGIPSTSGSLMKDPQVTLSSSRSLTEDSLATTQKGVLVCPDYETITWTCLYESHLNQPPSNVVMISMCPGNRELPVEARGQILSSLQEAGVSHESILYSFKGDVGSPFSYCSISFDSVDSAKTWLDKCNGTFQFDVPCPEDENTLLNFQNCYLQEPSSGGGGTSYLIKSKLHYSLANWLCSCGKSNFPLRSLCHNCFKNMNKISDYQSVSEATAFVGVKWSEYDVVYYNPFYTLRRLGHNVLKVALFLDPALPRDPCGLMILEVGSVEEGTKLYSFLAASASLQDRENTQLNKMLGKSSGMSYFKCSNSLEHNWTFCSSPNWDIFFTNETPTNILVVDMDTSEKAVVDIPLEQYGGEIRKCRPLGGFIPSCWMIYFPTSEAAKEWYDANNGKLRDPVSSRLHCLYYSQDLWVCASCLTPNFPLRVLCHKCYRHKTNGLTPVSSSTERTRFIGIPSGEHQQKAVSSLTSGRHDEDEVFRLRSIHMFCDPNLRQHGSCILVFEVSNPIEAMRLRSFLENRGVKCFYAELFAHSKVSTHCDKKYSSPDSESRPLKSISEPKASPETDQVGESTSDTRVECEESPVADYVVGGGDELVETSLCSNVESHNPGSIPMDMSEFEALQEDQTPNTEADSSSKVLPILSDGDQKPPEIEQVAEPASDSRVECERPMADHDLAVSTADNNLVETASTPSWIPAHPPSSFVIIAPLTPSPAAIPSVYLYAQIQNILADDLVEFEGLSRCRAFESGAPWHYCIVKLVSPASGITWLEKHNRQIQLDVKGKGNRFKGKRTVHLYFGEDDWKCACGMTNYFERSFCHGCFMLKSGLGFSFIKRSASPSLWVAVRKPWPTKNKNSTNCIENWMTNLQKAGFQFTSGPTFHSDPGLKGEYVHGFYIFKCSNLDESIRLLSCFEPKLRAMFVTPSP